MVIGDPQAVHNFLLHALVFSQSPFSPILFDNIFRKPSANNFCFCIIFFNFRLPTNGTFLCLDQGAWTNPRLSASDVKPKLVTDNPNWNFTILSPWWLETRMSNHVGAGFSLVKSCQLRQIRCALTGRIKSIIKRNGISSVYCLQRGVFAVFSQIYSIIRKRCVTNKD